MAKIGNYYFFFLIFMALKDKEQIRETKFAINMLKLNSGPLLTIKIDTYLTLFHGRRSYMNRLKYYDLWSRSLHSTFFELSKI